MNSHLIIPRRPPNPPKLLGIHSHRVLPVLLEHRQRLLVVDLPHPVRVPRDPDLGEGDEFAARLAGFVDEVNGLADAGFEVEPGGFGGDLCDVEFEGSWEGGEKGIVRLRLCIL